LKKYAILSLSVLCFFIAATYADQGAQNSSLVWVSSEVAQQPGGAWKITVTATATLGMNDTYQGIKTQFTDPNGNVVAPFVNFTPPAQGKSSTLTFWTTTGVAGQWNASATMSVTLADGTPAPQAFGVKITVK
jgi:hypothetical protein